MCSLAAQVHELCRIPRFGVTAYLADDSGRTADWATDSETTAITVERDWIADPRFLAVAFRDFQSGETRVTPAAGAP